MSVQNWYPGLQSEESFREWQQQQAQPTPFKSGDLIAVSGKGFVSNLIQAGTVALPNVGPLGRWGMAGVSHVGIICHVWGIPLVYESTSFPRPPDVRQPWRTEPVGVQSHYLDTILNAGGDVFHYPLKRVLYDHEEERLCQVLDGCLGQDYDYFGAATAWGGVLRWVARRLVAKERLATLFCSELVAHAWAQIGMIQTPVAGAWNPTRLVRYAVRRGITEKGRLLS